MASPRTSTKNPASTPPTAEPPKAEPGTEKPKAEKPSASDAHHGPTPPKNLVEAKLRVMAAVPYIRKRGRMQGGGSYPYVRDSDVIAILRGPMIANGLALCGPIKIEEQIHDEVKTGSGKGLYRTRARYCFQLRFMFTNESEDVWVVGVGTDSLDKDANKSMAAARKYAYLLAFSIATGDDPDAFDAEGKHAGGDEDEHEGTKAESGPGTRAPSSPPPAPKPTPAPASPPPPPPPDKTNPSKPSGAAPANALPATGKELRERLTAYDDKLAAHKLIVKGELLAHITQVGVRAGYSANMDEWGEAAIKLAAGEVAGFEKDARERKDKANAEADRVAAAEKRAVEAREAEKKAEADKAASGPPPASNPAPAAGDKKADTRTPQEKFDQRIAGMNGSKKKDNLDSFRKIYSADKDMTEDMLAQLEQCYWTNVTRLNSAKKSA